LGAARGPGLGPCPGSVGVCESVRVWGGAGVVVDADADLVWTHGREQPCCRSWIQGVRVRNEAEKKQQQSGHPLWVPRIALISWAVFGPSLGDSFQSTL
jgi:hypothetical protein